MQPDLDKVQALGAYIAKKVQARDAMQSSTVSAQIPSMAYAAPMPTSAGR